MTQGTEDPAPAARTKAFLVDPATMTIAWMNGAAAEGCAEDAAAVGCDLVAAVPLAEMLAVPEAAREVARTGESRHLHRDVISTAKGSMAMAMSIDRLPDGMLLILVENTWVQAQPRTERQPGSRRPARRGR